MISVIICSKEKKRLESLLHNIDDTIGTPYEVIAWDNNNLNLGICEVYNSAVQKALYEVLCFVHEDVKFSTMNWGKKVISHLSNPSTGLIGIAGSAIKSLVPSSWSVPAQYNYAHLFQHYRYKISDPEYVRMTGDRQEILSQHVCVLDGVFLCTRKEVFEKFKFDQSLFNGFHGYDIDYALQVSASYDVKVVFDILLHHFSEGNPGRDWMECAMQIGHKWKNILPFSVGAFTKEELGQHHWAAMQVFIYRLVKLDYSAGKILHYYFRYAFGPFFTIRRFGSMFKYILSMLRERFIEHHGKRRPFFLFFHSLPKSSA